MEPKTQINSTNQSHLRKYLICIYMFVSRASVAGLTDNLDEQEVDGGGKEAEKASLSHLSAGIAHLKDYNYTGNFYRRLLVQLIPQAEREPFNTFTDKFS